MTHTLKTARAQVVRTGGLALTAVLVLLAAGACASPDRMPPGYRSSSPSSSSPDAAAQTPTDAMTPVGVPATPTPATSAPIVSAPATPASTAASATSAPTSSKPTSAAPSAVKTTTTTGPFALHPNGGVGSFATGASEASVTAWLNQRFGKPDSVTSGVWCEVFDQSPYSATYHYGKLDVTFFAKAGQRSTTAPRTLAGWTYHLPQPANSAVILPDGLPSSPTYAQLKKSFPTGTFEDIEILDPMFILPDGVVLIGSPQPTTVYDASRPIFCD